MGRHLDKALADLSEYGAAVVAAIAGGGHLGSSSGGFAGRWDPAKHKRNRLGQFASVLANATGHVRLPNGVHVRRHGAGYHVIDSAGSKVKVDAAMRRGRGASASARAAALALRADENGGRFPSGMKSKGPGFFSRRGRDA